MIMINVKGPGSKTDETETRLATDDLRYVVLCEAVTALEEIAPRASVILHLVFGHDPVVAWPTAICEAARFRPVPPERGQSLDLLATRTILESLRHVRPLAHLLALLRHSLAITRLRTDSEALLAILGEAVGPTLVTPELRRPFLHPTVRACFDRWD
jgi:hypothetical protein